MGRKNKEMAIACVHLWVRLVGGVPVYIFNVPVADLGHLSLSEEDVW